jgi:hypothetical protein
MVVTVGLGRGDDRQALAGPAGARDGSQHAPPEGRDMRGRRRQHAPSQHPGDYIAPGDDASIAPDEREPGSHKPAPVDRDGGESF